MDLLRLATLASAQSENPLDPLSSGLFDYREGGENFQAIEEQGDSTGTLTAPWSANSFYFQSPVCPTFMAPPWPAVDPRYPNPRFLPAGGEMWSNYGWPAGGPAPHMPHGNVPHYPLYTERPINTEVNLENPAKNSLAGHPKGPASNQSLDDFYSDLATILGFKGDSQDSYNRTHLLGICFDLLKKLDSVFISCFNVKMPDILLRLLFVACDTKRMSPTRGPQASDKQAAILDVIRAKVSLLKGTSTKVPNIKEIAKKIQDRLLEMSSPPGSTRHHKSKPEKWEKNSDGLYFYTKLKALFGYSDLNLTNSKSKRLLVAACFHMFNALSPYRIDKTANGKLTIQLAELHGLLKDRTTEDPNSRVIKAELLRYFEDAAVWWKISGIQIPEMKWLKSTLFPDSSNPIPEAHDSQDSASTDESTDVETSVTRTPRQTRSSLRDSDRKKSARIASSSKVVVVGAAAASEAKATNGPKKKQGKEDRSSATFYATLATLFGCPNLNTDKATDKRLLLAICFAVIDQLNETTIQRVASSNIEYLFRKLCVFLKVKSKSLDSMGVHAQRKIILEAVTSKFSDWKNRGKLLPDTRALSMLVFGLKRDTRSGEQQVEAKRTVELPIKVRESPRKAVSGAITKLDSSSVAKEKSPLASPKVARKRLRQRLSGCQRIP